MPTGAPGNSWELNSQAFPVSVSRIAFRESMRVLSPGSKLVRDSALLSESRDSARELMGKERDLGKYEKLFGHVKAKWGSMLELDTSS